MNKKDFIAELQKQTNHTGEECNLINEVLEDHFIIGKKNKEKIIQDLKDKLNISMEKANEIYETAMKIISGGIIKKIKNPFKHDKK